ncbi:glycosyltransferase family 4 protein [Roseiconus lacunae]|uniref:glycosyltransferase family 4 protein n=1 Tax=Roseiconus lacunae TaxID=2605694 RepID=UPI001E547FB0|nr:glycosyltransferase family 4 protein [Roseiconus lacunae]MCD0458903.1 glycosyltransferase family 4 protein [Roseiconus lacunae]
MSFQMRPLVLHTRVISGQGGGPEKTILNSPRFLDDLGFDSQCVYLRHPGDDGFEIIRQRAQQKRAPLVEVDDFGIKDFGVVKRMRRAVERLLETRESQARTVGGEVASRERSGAPETFESELATHPSPLATSASSRLIWHGHDYKSNLIGLLLRKHFPEMRLATTVHGWVQKTWKTPLYYAIDRWCLSRYEQVICVSRDLFEDCQRLGVEPSRLSLIDNAIALDDYDFDLPSAEAKTQLGLPTSIQLVAAVGRLSDEKGFDLLIEATVDLIRQGRDVGLVIAGDGAFRAALQSQIDASGFGDRIKLLGFVADPRVVYRAADLYVLSSYREGLPNVVLEAMAMNVPVVSTNIAGMPDLIDDGENGVMIDVGRADAIHDAVRSLLDAPEKRARLAEAGRKTVEERFSFRRRMERMVEVYGWE